MIPRIDASAMTRGDQATLDAMAQAATGTGFLLVHNTALTPERVKAALIAYRSFFKRSDAEKRAVDMSLTGANRGWGAEGSEQVNPEANPDFKQFFDCGYQVPEDHPHAGKAVYAPNIWPEDQTFRRVISSYYTDALQVAGDVLAGVVRAIGGDPAHFAQAFAQPMALLRGNYYPARPDWAGARDFGIATHTDYGCLTLLATDGSPGLEVRKRGGGWIPLAPQPGEFAINFGEMLEFWTAGKVVATPHRVVGGEAERLSIPLFYNPSYETNVAPPGSDDVILAGEHLTKRFKETYVHLKT